MHSKQIIQFKKIVYFRIIGPRRLVDWQLYEFGPNEFGHIIRNQKFGPNEFGHIIRNKKFGPNEFGHIIRNQKFGPNELGRIIRNHKIILIES